MREVDKDVIEAAERDYRDCMNASCNKEFPLPECDPDAAMECPNYHLCEAVHARNEAGEQGPTVTHLLASGTGVAICGEVPAKEKQVGTGRPMVIDDPVEDDICPRCLELGMELGVIDDKPTPAEARNRFSGVPPGKTAMVTTEDSISWTGEPPADYGMRVEREAEPSPAEAVVREMLACVKTYCEHRRPGSSWKLHEEDPRAYALLNRCDAIARKHGLELE